MARSKKVGNEPVAPETHAGRPKPPVPDKIHAKHSSVVNTKGKPIKNTTAKVLAPAPETKLGRDNADDDES